MRRGGQVRAGDSLFTLILLNLESASPDQLVEAPRSVCALCLLLRISNEIDFDTRLVCKPRSFWLYSFHQAMVQICSVRTIFLGEQQSRLQLAHFGFFASVQPSHAFCAHEAEKLSKCVAIGDAVTLSINDDSGIRFI